MNPMRILLVDDELLALNHVERLISQAGDHLFIVEKALSGSQALHKSKVFDPQLIFMDICMPGQDGIETSKMMLEQGSNALIYLLTSHRDFDYAKRAIEIGVSGYLLKHEMNVEQLTKTLLEIRDQWHLRHQVERESLGRAMMKYLNPDVATVEAWQMIASRFSITCSRLLLCAVYPQRPYAVVASSFSEVASFDVPQRLLEYLYEEHQNGISHAPLPGGGILLLFEMIPMNSRQQARGYQQQVARKIEQAFCKQMMPVSLVIADAPLTAGGWVETFAQLNRCASRLVYERRDVIRFVEDIVVECDSEKEIERLRGELFRLFRIQESGCQIEEVERTVKQLFTQGANGLAPTVLRWLCDELIRDLDGRCEKRQITTYTERALFEKLDTRDWHSIRDIGDWFAAQFALLLREDDVQKSYSRKIREVMQLIEAQFAQELRIESLGEQIHLSGERLRHLFKAETGQTIMEYVTSCRIEQAKRYLSEGRLKVYEIAALVGYGDSRYFSQVFKKMTGMTPQAYTEHGGAS